MRDWRGDRAERANPYLDWELRNRPLGKRLDWCSVQIQLLPEANGSYVAHLGQLAAIVAAGHEPDEPADALTVRMSADEFDLLTKLIDDIRIGRVPPPDDPRDVQFFIYRPEDIANRTAANGLFTAIHVGPPIPGLRFDSGIAAPTDLGKPLTDLTRQVAIGVIDDGIAFANRRFRSRSGRSRIRAIWLQDVERRTKDFGVAAGQRLTGEELDALFAANASEADIYRAFGMTDFGNEQRKPLAQRVSHGTHILDLSGGYDPTAEDIGSKRPLLAVQLPSPVSSDTTGVTMASYVLQGARQIMLWADRINPKLPLVINFSYGIAAGPKNGSHEIEQALSRMIERRNQRGGPTYLVLPAGNSYRERTTGRMVVQPGASDQIDWIMLPDDGTSNHLEIWLDGEAIAQQWPRVGVSLTPPGDVPRKIDGFGDGDVQVLEDDGKPIAAINGHLAKVAGQPDRVRFHLSVNPTTARWSVRHPAPAGRWRLSVTNGSEAPLTAHLYIQRDDTPLGYVQHGRQSYFDHAGGYQRAALDGSYSDPDSSGCPMTREDTLSALATGAGALVVGAVDAAGQPTDYTASGPTPGRAEPDCAAIADQGPAHWGVLAAGTRSGSVVAMRGTSVAAPQLVRRLADYLASLQPGPVLASLAVTDGPVASSDGPPPGAAVLEPIKQDAVAASPCDHARIGSFILRASGHPGLPPRTYPRSPNLR
ncbi:S8 family serine peptidase [Bradyrhizobium sp. SZCCHNS3052]|uniref:S8 family serine peptidase n=1 Tax=Bradyrhizobium sp. SZCCHNS3052 TaxID=3057321 RepID=UPI0029167FE0|nr:S8 family serine peptidase [Bradyrhizobium sp. SZCCHNS3052]